MAEAGLDDEHRKNRAGWNEGQKQAKDQTKRYKPDRSNTSQGPLSSIKAAFRRTSSPLSEDSAGEKRWPELTIASVTLAHSASSQIVWDGQLQRAEQLPPSYAQVIIEKTEKKVQTPVVPPRQSHSSSIATQTEEEGTLNKQEYNRSAESAKKIKKHPKVSHSGEGTRTPASAINPNPHQLCNAQHSVQSETTALSATPHPVPRPRSKPNPLITHKITLQEVDNRDLVTLKENNPPHTDKHLKELLEILHTFDFSHPEREKSEQDLIEDMTSFYSERNIRAKIQEFENQVSPGENSVPTPRPRTSKPVLATKPNMVSLASITSTTAGETTVPDAASNIFNKVLDDCFNSTPTHPALFPRPPISTKPSLNSTDQLKTLIKSQPSLFSSNHLHSQDEENVFNSSLLSIGKEVMNLNNHNSTQNDHGWASSAIPRPVGRKPTIIRVPSKLEDELNLPPTLPVQKAIGCPSASLRHKESFGYKCELQLPLRSGGDNPFPPRPPPAKSGPGRPPPPRKDNIQRNSSQLQSQQNRKASRKGPVLPPRPNPGHRLYNTYTLVIPHGIAEFDYNGMQTGELSFQKNEVLVLLNQKDNNTFECQVGDAKGSVKKSHMKIITPLSKYCHEVQPVLQQSTSHQDFRSSTKNGPLMVQALYDFTPEGPGELGLKAGDIITDLEPLGSEWYLGTCKGNRGFFPTNYTKPLSGSPACAPQPTSASASAKSTTHNIRGPRCVARFDFEADEPGELSFIEGDVIRLLEYVGEEWGRGEISGHEGIFPLNFVEVIEDLPSPVVKNQSKNTVHGNAAASTPKQKVEWLLALYDFTTETDGDLSFVRGDVIELIQHIDEEWSHGRLNSKEGIFPTSFTQPHSGGFQSR